MRVRSIAPDLGSRWESLEPPGGLPSVLPGFGAPGCIRRGWFREAERHVPASTGALFAALTGGESSSARTSLIDLMPAGRAPSRAWRRSVSMRNNGARSNSMEYLPPGEFELCWKHLLHRFDG